eukprot:9135-Rhodomonas_salina.4
MSGPDDACGRRIHERMTLSSMSKITPRRAAPIVGHDTLEVEELCGRVGRGRAFGSCDVQGHCCRGEMWSWG